MADMVKKAIWIVLPFLDVCNWPNLQVSPIGIVPQHGQQPRIIIDYSYYLLNQETAKLTPQESMQFGWAFEQIIVQTMGANPHFGPVHFIKINISDRFTASNSEPKTFPSSEWPSPLVPAKNPWLRFRWPCPWG